MGKCRTLVFTGNGKGKTTAALGMVLRACGHGIRVKMVQFIKVDGSTGEITAVKNLPGVEIVQTGLGFVPPERSPKFAEHVEAARRGLELAREAMESREYGLVVLDEVCTAVSMGLLDEASVVHVIEMAAEDAVVVMTGRGAGEGLIRLADTVTEMREVKHGMCEGWGAREGVEF